MKQAEIRRYRPGERTNPYLAAGWMALLAALLLSGSLLTMQRLWNGRAPSLAAVFAAAALSALCGAAADFAAKRIPAAQLLALAPVPAVLIVTGFHGYIAGGRAWLNTMLDRWNTVHEGGLALFSGTASERDVWAFALLAAVLIGLLLWYAVSRQSSRLAAFISVFWLLLSLFGEGFYPLALVLLTAGQLGLHMTSGSRAITRRAVAWCLGISTVLCACAVGLSGTEMPSVDRLRQNIKQTVHDLRYGRDTLPQGELSQANLLHESSETMLNVHTEQEKSVYLRGFTGGKYENGTWKPLPDAVYGGENIGMLDWLQTQGFDPLTQSAAYYRLTGDAPETNTVEVSVQNASRDAVYAPASMEKVTDGDVHERRDALLKGRGLFGIRNYTVTEVSGTRPSELMVAESWVSNPQTEEQTAYAQAESVYRSFVYDAYTAADEDLLPVLNRLFWQDYDDENDGVYSALSRIREVLKAQVRYSEIAEAAPDNADPIAYFLTDLRKGNAVLYASATVQALRAHGIPARYAEGYYLPIAKTQSSADGTAALTGQDAHAWAEVYFDGIGWLPVDATPGYYFDAVALQQMVSLPDTVRKTAAIDEDRSGADQVVEPSGTGGSEQSKPLTVVKNVVAVGLGIAGIVIVLFTLLLCAMELTRAFLLWHAERKRRRMSIEERVRQSQKLMFKLISLWGIDAALGWETAATDKALADTLPSVKPGEYERVNGLLEKTIYGGIALEPFEERALDLFVQRLWGRNVKKSWKMRLKLRYACLLAAK